MSAWIGLGGNLDDPRARIAAALQRLAAEPGITLLRRSRDYRTPPWGVADQPDFVNAVAELETERPPRELLQVLLAVEAALGRRRGASSRWGPRCIDIDLLTYDELELSADDLQLPHPRMHLRAFVLVPLLELEPGFVIPGRGPAAECLRRIEAEEIAAVTPLPAAATEGKTR